ncbi:hypothetical protein [Pseudofrankia sp. DC12]|uniref:hypothetical protein n=1 Tax=Pseudofrankia sp. DC12 TaxID=683315 RepID=UPI000A74F196|nr:hypothetical protein [Pseudofrankia sp. DC12]
MAVDETTTVPRPGRGPAEPPASSPPSVYAPTPSRGSQRAEDPGERTTRVERPRTERRDTVDPAPPDRASPAGERTTKVDRARLERRGTADPAAPGRGVAGPASDAAGPAGERTARVDRSRVTRRDTVDDPAAVTSRGVGVPKAPPPDSTELLDRRKITGAASDGRPATPPAGRAPADRAAADRPAVDRGATQATRPVGHRALAEPNPAETTMRISRRDLPGGRQGRIALLADPLVAETTMHMSRSAMPPGSLLFQTGPVPIPLREELTGAAPTPPPEEPQAPSLLRRVPAGLVDSSLSSLGSFMMGVFAQYFLPTMLGTYGLFYTAFIAVSVIPTGIVFSPVEYTSAGVAARHRRVQLLPQSLQLGMAPAVLAALLVPLVLIIPSHGQSADSRVGFAVTAALVAVASPMQDHIRRMLHQAGMSWTAAATSFVQVLAVTLGLVTAKVAHVPPAWVPFGALAVANFVSGAFGLWKAKPGHRAPMLLKLRTLFVSMGGWIVVGNVLSASGPFLNFALLTALSGQADVGSGEGARVLAQPVTVLVIGLLAVLNPEIMEAAHNRSVRRLIKICLLFWGLVAVAILGWALLVGFEWPFNPLPRFQKPAYRVHGLLPWTIVTEGAGYSVLVLITIANAAGRARAASVASLVAVVVSGIAVAATAKALGSFALIWGAGATLLAMYVVNGAVIVREFRRPAQPAATASLAVPAPPAVPGPVGPVSPGRPAAGPGRPAMPVPSRPVAPGPVPGRGPAAGPGPAEVPARRATRPPAPMPAPPTPRQPRPAPAASQADPRPPAPAPRPEPEPEQPTPAARRGRGRHSSGGSGLRRPDVFDRGR